MSALTPNATRILEARYLLRDPAGEIAEDWDGLARRAAQTACACRLGREP